MTPVPVEVARNIKNAAGMNKGFKIIADNWRISWEKSRLGIS